jgi:hypothetical protein
VRTVPPSAWQRNFAGCSDGACAARRLARQCQFGRCLNFYCLMCTTWRVPGGSAAKRALTLNHLTFMNVSTRRRNEIYAVAQYTSRLINIPLFHRTNTLASVFVRDSRETPRQSFIGRRPDSSLPSDATSPARAGCPQDAGEAPNHFAPCNRHPGIETQSTTRTTRSLHERILMEALG